MSDLSRTDHGQARPVPSRRAFAPIDLVATMAMAAVALALLALGAAESRRAGQLDEAINNLKRFAAGTEAYAADHAEQLWGFTWQDGETYEFMDENGDIVEYTPYSDIDAGVHQAVHLVRLMDDRIGEHGIGVPAVWVPHPSLSHLPLVRYLGAHPLDRWTADPGDRHRLNWKDDPINKFDEGYWLPFQPSPNLSVGKLAPYKSSYRAVPATWNLDQNDLDDGAPGRVSQGGTHNGFFYPLGASLLAASRAGVAYPAHKVHLSDRNERHFGPRRPFLGLDEARLPIGFFDGSVRVHQTTDGNPGWQPNEPTAPCDVFSYWPQAWEPGTVSGEKTDLVQGAYFWTRGGLNGVDFGAFPLDTGQMTPGECEF